MVPGAQNWWVMDDEHSNLRRLARRCGVQTSYVDIYGRLHHAGDEPVRAVLSAMGIDPDSEPPHPEPGPRSEGAPREISGPQRRLWALFAPVHSLRRTRDRGVGTLAHLLGLARSEAARGASFIAVLPMLAGWPGDSSPYSPLSRQAWSELYLDLDHLPGLELVPELRADLPPSTASGRQVDQPAVGLAVDAFVDRVAVALAGEDRMRDAVESFAVHERPDLALYARFRALAERNGRNWRTWPGGAHVGGEGDREASPLRVFRHLYGQYAMERQLGELADELAGRGQALALDLPIGAAADGFDTWAAPEDFALGVSIGAPPDDFFASGQNWGLPPLNPTMILDQGPVGFVGALRHHLGHAGLLRIDHVMGLHRQWWIPHGFDAADGVYVGYPSSRIYDLMVAESMLHEALLVGEDLGTVEPGVREEMQSRGVMGMWELQFAAMDPEGGLVLPDRSVVAGCNTHDMAPFASFWDGGDLAELASLGYVDDLGRARQERSEVVGRLARLLGAALGRPPPTNADEGFDAALEYMAHSSAPVVAASLDDMLGDTVAQNVPGTLDSQRPNWRARTRLTLEEIQQSELVRWRRAILGGVRDAGRV